MDSLEETQTLGKIKGRRRRGQQMGGHYHQLDEHNKLEQTREIVKDEGAGELRLVRSQGIEHSKLEQTQEIVKDEGAGVLQFVRSQGIAHDLGIK